MVRKAKKGQKLNISLTFIFISDINKSIIYNIIAIKISELMNFYRTKNNIRPATEVVAAAYDM